MFNIHVHVHIVRKPGIVTGQLTMVIIRRMASFQVRSSMNDLKNINMPATLSSQPTAHTQKMIIVVFPLHVPVSPGDGPNEN